MSVLCLMHINIHLYINKYIFVFIKFYLLEIIIVYSSSVLINYYYYYYYFVYRRVDYYAHLRTQHNTSGLEARGSSPQHKYTCTAHLATTGSPEDNLKIKSKRRLWRYFFWLAESYKMNIPNSCKF